VWVHRHVLIPLVDDLSGAAGSLGSTLRKSTVEFPHHWYGKLQYLAQFVLGDISETDFVTQPCRLYIKARTLLAQAFRAEFLANPEQARENYRKYLELHELERCSDSARGDPIVERWARFRSREAIG